MEDVVTADQVAGVPVVTEPILHAGHSTYRIFLVDGVKIDAPAFREHWSALERLGCTYEQATEHLFAIDVPPDADIYRVYELLEEGEARHLWAFEEGHCGHC